jgi:hypothetical protein
MNYYFSLLVDYVLVSWFGWAPFLVVLVWMLYFLKKQAANEAYVATVEWVFLEVRIDELSEKSPLAMEQIFAALHAIHQNFTFGELFNGKTILWMSCEIVSLGGKVSYIFKIPARYRTLFESALFAQYPKAEVTETEDYLKNLPHYYDPERADFDFWGTEWLKKKDNAYPIRTYWQDTSFEHGAQETFVDPLSNVLEVMSNLQPHELMVYQLVIKPSDDKWKDHIQHMIDEMKGVPHAHSDSIFDKLVFFIPDLIATILVEIVSGPPEGKSAPVKVKEEPPSLMLHKTDVEKLVINAIEHAKGKIGYEIRLRTMYLAPKDKFNKGLRIPEIVGAFRNFDDVNFNGIKPDIGHSWTDKTYKLSEKLERPYLQFNILTRKRHFLHWITARSHWRGVGKVRMNTEELASIFHFPQAPHTRVSQLERVHTVKSAPPMDLPIG